jgi:hypothetical protein
MIDWDRTAELAGLDAGERIVLDLQLMGLGRERALSLCYTDDDRKLLQAAWKRFVRHKEALRGLYCQARDIKAEGSSRPIRKNRWNWSL